MIGEQKKKPYFKRIRKTWSLDPHERVKQSKKRYKRQEYKKISDDDDGTYGDEHDEGLT